MDDQTSSVTKGYETPVYTRFTMLDGLRGWLAGSVVLCHIIFMSKLDEHYRVAAMLRRTGDDAVMIFVILSGFVITHLIVIRQERYGAYLLRRFFRIFPIYAVCTSASALCALF